MFVYLRGLRIPSYWIWLHLTSPQVSLVMNSTSLSVGTTLYHPNIGRQSFQSLPCRWQCLCHAGWSVKGWWFHQNWCCFGQPPRIDRLITIKHDLFEKHMLDATWDRGVYYKEHGGMGHGYLNMGMSLVSYIWYTLLGTFPKGVHIGDPIFSFRTYGFFFVVIIFLAVALSSEEEFFDFANALFLIFTTFFAGVLDRNFRLLNWRYCTFSWGHILWGYSLQFSPEELALYMVGTSNRSVPEMAMDGKIVWNMESSKMSWSFQRKIHEHCKWDDMGFERFVQITTGSKEPPCPLKSLNRSCQPPRRLMSPGTKAWNFYQHLEGRGLKSGSTHFCPWPIYATNRNNMAMWWTNTQTPPFGSFCIVINDVVVWFNDTQSPPFGSFLYTHQR